MKQKTNLFILLMLLASSVSAQMVKTYTYPDEIGTSDAYQVTVNQQQVFVYETFVAAAAIFEFEGKVEIKIKANRDVKWVDVRPKSKNIIPRFQDSTIWLTLNEPANLSIELNGEPKNLPLFLFANPPEKNKPSKNNPDVIWFEAGKFHKPGIIKVKSNQTVYIEGGAVVQGLIHAQNANNVRIAGYGILDGSNNQALRGKDRIRFVQLENCKNVILEGLTLASSTCWQVVPINSENLKIDNIKIFSNDGGDDGMDLARSRNIKISNCFIHTKDDCIAIKTTFDYPPEVTSGNIDVHDCVFWNTEWGNALEIGFELRSSKLENVVFRNCDVIHCEDGAVFSIHNGDSCRVSDIHFENIRVEDASQKLIDVAIFYTKYSVDGPETDAEYKRRYLHGIWDNVMWLSPEEKKQYAAKRGHINDVTFKNIQIVDGLFPFSVIWGYDENHLVQNVTIENLTVKGKKIETLKQAKITSKYAKNIIIK